MSIKSASIIHSQVTSEETPDIWSPQPLRHEKEGILERVTNLEQALVLLLEYPTDLICQKRAQRCANRLALLLQTCGFSFAVQLVFGIEQMLINGLFFDDSWRSQLAEFVGVVRETVERGLLLTTVPKE
jgi:hypothetical protein